MTKRIEFTVVVEISNEGPHIFQFDGIGMARFLLHWDIGHVAAIVEALSMGKTLKVYPYRGVVIEITRVERWQ